MEDLGEELIQAAQEGRLPKVRKILSEAAESPDIAQETLMSLELEIEELLEVMSVENYRCVVAILQFMPYDEALEKKFLQKWFLAGFEGNADFCSILLQRGPPINDQQPPRHGTALFDACQFLGLSRLHRQLIENDVDINANFIRDGKSPLHACLSIGSTKLMSLLLNHGADVHARDQRGFTASMLLSMAVYTIHDADLLELLLCRDAGVDAVCQRTGNRLLHWAAHTGRVSILQTLLRNATYTDLTARNHINRTPLCCALARRDAVAVDLLSSALNQQITQGITPSPEITTLLHRAAAFLSALYAHLVPLSHLTHRQTSYLLPRLDTVVIGSLACSLDRRMQHHGTDAPFFVDSWASDSVHHRIVRQVITGMDLSAYRPDPPAPPIAIPGQLQHQSANGDAQGPGSNERILHSPEALEILKEKHERLAMQYRLSFSSIPGSELRDFLQEEKVANEAKDKSRLPYSRLAHLLNDALTFTLVSCSARLRRPQPLTSSVIPSLKEDDDIDEEANEDEDSEDEGATIQTRRRQKKGTRGRIDNGQHLLSLRASLLGERLLHLVSSCASSTMNPTASTSTSSSIPLFSEQPIMLVPRHYLEVHEDDVEGTLGFEEGRPEW